MIGWYLLLGILALLVTILLFGFVGCADLVEATGDEYFDIVTSTSGLIAYWRLGEGPEESVVAANAVGGPVGLYADLAPEGNSDDQRHSPATTGTHILGFAGLLGGPQTCILTDGGYVKVPWQNELNPPEFTFEAWVLPDPFGLEKSFFYCLAESTGPSGLDQKKKGWGLYLGPDDPDNPSGLFWQVWMGDGNQFNRVAIAKPDFPTPGFDQLRLTYLALTFDGIQNLQLWLRYPDTEQDFDNLQALEDPETIIFRRNDALPDGQGNFYIGTGSNLFPEAGAPPQRLYPFKGRIQEVALYHKDLSKPNNEGVMENLLPRFLSAQNV